MRRFAILVPLLTIVLAACAVPFSYTTDEATVSLPVQSQFATAEDEQVIDIPDDATRDALRYDSVRIHYEVTTDNAFDADVRFWVSDDETPDGTYTADEEELIVDETIQNGETISGSRASEELVRALNAGNDVFVVGGYAESLVPGGGTVTITLFAEISGRVEPGR